MKIVNTLALSLIRAKFRIISFFSPTRAAKSAFILFCTPPSRDVPEVPKFFLDAEQLNFEYEGYRIVGYRWNKGAGKRVLIVHGFESTVINFQRYIEPLSKREMEVLAFDAPAHGRSSGKTMNALIYSRFIQHIYERFGHVDSFVAHSLGALSLCLALSELRLTTPARVALIAPATTTVTAVESYCRHLQIAPKVKQELYSLIEKVAGRPVDSISIIATVQHVNGEILWVHDQDDRVTPLADCEPIIKANYPHIRFEITKGLGHSRIYRDARILNMVVEYL